MKFGTFFRCRIYFIAMREHIVPTSFVIDGNIIYACYDLITTAERPLMAGRQGKCTRPTAQPTRNLWGAKLAIIATWKRQWLRVGLGRAAWFHGREPASVKCIWRQRKQWICWNQLATTPNRNGWQDMVGDDKCNAEKTNETQGWRWRRTLSSPTSIWKLKRHRTDIEEYARKHGNEWRWRNDLNTFYNGERMLWPSEKKEGNKRR